MRKSDKKLDKQICDELTQVCHMALAEIDGFVWLTHLVNYNRFPDSLIIVCVFETDQMLALANAQGADIKLRNWIVTQLKLIDIRIQKPNQQVLFDSEEACRLNHNGDWALRFSAH